MNRRGLALLAVGALAALTVLPSGAVGASDIRSQPFAMTAKRIPHSGFGEPSIAMTSKDHIFFCGPIGIPGGEIDFIRSADWETFTTQRVFDRGGGGDCDIETGPAQDGGEAVYTANLQAVASAVRRSIDDGVTFNDMASEDLIEQDRQWLATDPTDPNIVYLAYHDFSADVIIVAKSLDAGATWLVHSVASNDPAEIGGQVRATTPGPIRVDPTDPSRVYMMWTTSSVDACTADLQTCPFRQLKQAVKLIVARSDDGGLSWTDSTAIDTPPGSNIGQIIPWMSLDKAGNVYVAVAGHLPVNGEQTNGLFMAASTDHGATWSGPVKVNAGSGATAFPTVAGGGDGIADFAWIESTAATTEDTTGEWTVHFAQSRDATSVAPSFSEVTGPVIHHGDVCTQGLGCLLGGDRSLLDFMDMQIDSFGYAHMAVTQNAVSQLSVLYWRQDAGPSAYSEPCANDGDDDCVTVRPGPRP